MFARISGIFTKTSPKYVRPYVEGFAQKDFCPLELLNGGGSSCLPKPHIGPAVAIFAPDQRIFVFQVGLFARARSTCFSI